MKYMKPEKKSKEQKLAKIFLHIALVYTFIFPLNSLFAEAKNRNSNQDLASNDAHIALNSYQSRLSTVKENATSIRRKVSNARQKEQLALAQLQKTQRELYRIQSNYLETQNKMLKLNSDIKNVQTQISQIDRKVYKQSSALRENLRSVYMHKADILASLTESLFQSKSIIDFFNIAYFQKRFISRQLSDINGIRQQQNHLQALQSSWKGKQDNLQLAIQESERLKQAVSQKKNEQFDLVDRLRKERLAYESAERQLERESTELTRTILKLSNGSGIGLEDLIKNYFSFPVKAPITSAFGYRMHPIFRVRSFHSGVDLGARYGTPIKAANGGIVIYSGWYSGYGKTAIVSHSNGKSTLYAHMERVAVRNGEKVCQGQVLGYVGSTGYSTGPHLHFEYRLSGQPQNPLTVLR
jgi:murein DD-endopeptidase MepM/ murein hydrolase activator NlpD